MATVETSWYELIGQQAGQSPNTLLKCNHYATAVSCDDLQNVAMACVIPISKATYRIFDRNGVTVIEGEHKFLEEGVNLFTIKELVSADILKPYETESAEFGFETTVTLITGNTISRPFAFCCLLRTGDQTQVIPSPDMPKRLAAIPIANAAMTEAELRQICLDYMKLQVEFPFRFEQDFDYVIQSQKRPRKLLAGKVYGGIPYVSRGAGSLYRIAEVYDTKTGTINADSDIFDNIRYFGNACSGAASMSWARVVTSAYLGYTMFMTEANGFLPVGPYIYPKENVTKFVRNDPEGVCCRTVCDFNGEQTMYESYALLKPADGAVCDGHVRMNSGVPTVIRKADGTIDGDLSYTTMHEQVCYVPHRNHLRIAPDGTHFLAQGFVDVRYSFRKLWETAYIPFTFPEFANPSRVEPARVRLSVEPELKERVLTSNYPICDVFAQRNGKRYAFRNMEFFRKEVKMEDIFPEEALGTDTTISCRLYNGQLLEVPQ